MKFYRGYFPLNGKTPTMKWKREVVPDEGLLTLKQARRYPDYGAPLTEETALIDIDDKEQAEKMLELVQLEGIRCRAIRTDRGCHFLFNNKDKVLSKCATRVRFAVGLSGDVKVGLTNSYEKLKSHGKERPCVYGEDLTDTDQLDPVPEWLKVIGKADKTTNFPAMHEGDGRNTELYNLSFSLQKRGFRKEVVEETCRLLNQYVFDEPLAAAEFDLVMRDESMQVEPTFSEEELDSFGDRAYMKDQMDYSKKGELLPTIKNVEILIRMEPAFDGIRKNLLSDAIEAGKDLPWKRDSNKPEWTDDDDCQLRAYLEKFSKRFSRAAVFDATNNVANERMYHPVREYLEALPEWDGVERADRILVDFLGAEDSEYVRQVTRKTLCAAVRRVYDPGCKFDTLLVLNGAQGLGKSTLIRRLGGKWFGDSLLLSDICYSGKSAVEKIQGVWIEEIAELSGLKKVDIETLRSFITRQDDYGRPAYGRRAVHRPRQCVFFGTTNAQSEGFLRDTDGNRRFWIVDVPEEGGRRSVIGKNADLHQPEIDQIWAEIKKRVADGEPLYITDKDVLEEARRVQARNIEADPRQELIEAYLDKLLPEDWYDRSADDRINFFKYDDGTAAGTRLRQFVTYMELWTEALGEDPKKMSRIDKGAMKAIMMRLGWKIPPKTVKIRGKVMRPFMRNADVELIFG
ncbi:MAG TPA: hypothetical protein DCF66_03900 [Lachnospiraceae bacterium]|nr:hypothetical protein [Lachnospiraceae bacterium]